MWVGPLRLLVRQLARFARGADTTGESPAEPKPALLPPAGLDTFEPAPAAPAAPPRNLVAAFRADTFSGFVDGFEGAVRAPVNLSGGLEPIVPDAFELSKPAPVAVSTGFVASLDDLFPGAEESLGEPAEAAHDAFIPSEADLAFTPAAEGSETSEASSLPSPPGATVTASTATTEPVAASAVTQSSTEEGVAKVYAPVTEPAPVAVTEGAALANARTPATEPAEVSQSTSTAALTSSPPQESRPTEVPQSSSAAIGETVPPPSALTSSPGSAVEVSTSTDPLVANSQDSDSTATVDAEIDLLELAEALIGRP